MTYFKQSNRYLIVVALLVLICMAAAWVLINRSQTTQGVAVAKGAGAASNTAVMAVELLTPRTEQRAQRIVANGPVSAWQEAIVGAELSGVKLLEVKAQVGDSVRKGQTMAVFDSAALQLEAHQAKANLAEAQAYLTDATTQADRVRAMTNQGTLSAQQVSQILNAEKTGQAKVQSAQAALDTVLLKLKNTQLTAPDDGIVSARLATTGMVPAAGQELFRIVRQNKFEWHAQVSADAVDQIGSKTPVTISLPGQAEQAARIRAVSPVLDESSRMGLVYVELPAGLKVKQGMYIKGALELAPRTRLMIPVSAILQKDGMDTVFVAAPKAGQTTATVTQKAVQLGQQSGEDIEVLSGVTQDDLLVKSGATFLRSGDMVRIVKP